jgi:hypothetical protein
MGAGRHSTSSFCLLPLALVLVPTAGCRNCDLVEAELRTRNNELRELREEVHRIESQNQALLHDFAVLRQGPLALPPEAAAPVNSLRQISLGFGTGGVNEHNCPGDEALLVVLEPRDCDNHIIKAPGALHIEAVEISPEGLKTPLSSWDIAAHQLRDKWRTGIITGYKLILPWKTWPREERLRVVARLNLPDGRVFETDRDIVIHPAPAGERLKHPTAVPDDGPHFPGPPEAEPLPKPRQAPAESRRQKRSLWHRLFAPRGEVVPATYQAPAEPPRHLAQGVHLLTPVPEPDGQ